MITNDREVEYQQNLNSLPVAVVVIIVKSSAIEDIRPIYAKLFKTLGSLQPCELVHVQ